MDSSPAKEQMDDNSLQRLDESMLTCDGDGNDNCSSKECLQGGGETGKCMWPGVVGAVIANKRGGQ